MSSSAPITPTRGPLLRIVCVNDVYALDNFPRLATLVRHHAAIGAPDLFVTTMAGDFLAPSLLSSLDHGRGMVDCMNATPITHAIFGNHEAEIAMPELAKRIQEFAGTWLNTNMPTFTPRLPTHQILELTSPGGRTVRIGLLGLLVASPKLYPEGAFGGHAIEPVMDSALRWTRQLIDQEKCACVLPITHQPRADDMALARRQRDPRYPVVIGGHDHDVSLDEVEGTWIVKAGSDAVHAVVVDLVWPLEAPPAGAPDLPTVTVRLESVKDYPEDPEMRARVDRHLRVVRELNTATLLRLPPGATLSSIGTRRQQTSLGELLCSRIRDALNADGCLLNGGGIRASREYRERFTYGDLEAEVPFANEIVAVKMPGRVVREAVAASRARAPAEYSGYLQVDDRMLTDEAGAVIAIGGEPLVEGRAYRIATVQALLAGMDSIEPLIRFAQEHPDAIPTAESGREPKIILVEAFSVELWQRLGAFEQIDANGDGVLTADELRSAVAQVLKEPPSELVVNQMIKVLDANGDRVVSREEAGALLGGGRPPGQRS